MHRIDGKALLIAQRPLQFRELREERDGIIAAIPLLTPLSHLRGRQPRQLGTDFLMPLLY